MRKHLMFVTILSLMLIPTVSFGAIKLVKTNFGAKGKLYFTGELGYESMTYKVTEPKEGKETTTSTFTLNPWVSYFVIPGLAIGGIIDYTNVSVDPEEGDSSSRSQFGLGPIIGYYFKVHPVLFIYGRAYLVYFLSRSDDALDDQVDSLGGYYWALGAGVAVPFGKNVGGTLNLGFDYKSATDTAEPKQGDTQEAQTSGFMLKTGISLFF